MWWPSQGRQCQPRVYARRRARPLPYHSRVSRQVRRYASAIEITCTKELYQLERSVAQAFERHQRADRGPTLNCDARSAAPHLYPPKCGVGARQRVVASVGGWPLRQESPGASRTRCAARFAHQQRQMAAIRSGWSPPRPISSRWVHHNPCTELRSHDRVDAASFS